MYFPQKWPSIGRLDALLAKTLADSIIFFLFCLFWQTMGSVNAQMNPTQLQDTLKNFEMESTKMDMKEDMSELKQ